MLDRILTPTYYSDAEPGQARVLRVAGSTTGWSVNSVVDRADVWQASSIQEILIFARQNGDASYDPNVDRLATVSWAPGLRTVGAHLDGTDTVWVVADTVSQASLSCTRGDTLVVVPLTGHFNPVSKQMRLDGATLSALAGGVSTTRGDTVTGTYRTALPRYFWTANTDVSRFAWNASQNRWRPLSGGSPENLGITGATLARIQYPDTWVVAQVVPIIRVGSTPSDILSGYTDTVIVLSGDLDSYTWGNEIAIVSPEGDVRTNPQIDPGLVVWYCAQQHTLRNGDLGAPGVNWLTPQLRPYETPLLRVGQQSYLDVTVVETETDQDLLTLLPGQASVARLTGRVFVSQADQDLVNPASPGYQPALWGSHLWSDGVYLGQADLPAAVALTNLAGVASPLDATSDLYLPLVPVTPSVPSSGILTCPDGTNAPLSAGTVTTRPNGTGLLRYLGEGVCRVGDTSLQVSSTRLSGSHAVAPGSVIVTLEDRKVTLGWQDRQRFAGQYAWYTDLCVRPALSLGDTVWSLDPIPLITWQACTLDVTVTGGSVSISRTAGQETVSDFANALDALLAPLGAAAGHTAGHLWIQDLGGFVEIGFDRVAAKALRLIPGGRTGTCPVGFEIPVPLTSTLTRLRAGQVNIQSSRVLLDVPPLLDCWSLTPWRYHSVTNPLEPFAEITYRDRYAVLSQARSETRRYTQPVVDIPLEMPLVPESVRNFEIATSVEFASSSYTVAQGNLRVGQTYGDMRATGYAGTASTVFSDPNVPDLAATGVRAGDWLEIGGLVTWVSSVTGNQAALYPPIPPQAGVWTIRSREGGPLAGVWSPLTPVQDVPVMQVQHSLGTVPGIAIPPVPVTSVLIGQDTLTVTPLARAFLGSVGDVITLPMDRLVGANFRLLVGNAVLTLNLVSDLLSEPAVDTVDYLLNGDTRWSVTLLSALSGGLVQYQEIAGQAALGSVEMGNGSAAYNAQDALTYAGLKAWGVQALGADYRVSPTSGRIQVPPMPVDSRLAVQYRAADSYGSPLGAQDELARFQVTRETAIWTKECQWSFAAGREPVGQPVVWVDSLPVAAEVNLDRKTLTLSARQDQLVQVSYYSQVAAGGETTAGLQNPVSWGVVTVPKGSQSINVNTDGLEYGSWIDLDGWLAVVTAIGATSCQFSPATTQELGSRETGVPLSWKFCRAVDVWRQVPVTLVRAALGQSVVVIAEPDFTEYLILDGQPMRVLAHETVADGQALQLAFPLASIPITAYRLIGTMPVEGSTEVLGLGAADSLTLWRSDGDGASLVDAKFDPLTGNLLVAPVGQQTRIALTGSGPRILAPQQVGDQVLYPRVRVDYAVESVESYLGKTLTAQYLYAAPDSYFTSVSPVQDLIVPAVTDMPRLPVVSIPTGRLGQVNTDAQVNHERVLAGWRLWRSAQMLGGLDTLVNPRVTPLWARRNTLNLTGYGSNPRSTWNLAWNYQRGSNPLWLMPDDPLVTSTAVLVGDRLAGNPLTGGLDTQTTYRVHDLDDQFVPRLSRIVSTPWGRARYSSLVDGSVCQPYSRVLPSNQHVWGEVESPLPSAGQVLMPLASDVFPSGGVLTSVADRPRWAEVVQYSPTGFAAPFDPQCVGKPCFLLAINPSTFPKFADGTVDLGALASGGGSTPDLSTGDVSPAWYTFAQGSRQPLVLNGSPVQYLARVDNQGQPLPVYVSQVLDGCVITLAFDDGTSSGQEILDGSLISTLTTGTLVCQATETYTEGVDLRYSPEALLAVQSPVNSPSAGQSLDVFLTGTLPVLEGLDIPALDGRALADDGDQPPQHPLVEDRFQALLAMDTHLASMLEESAGKQLLPDPYPLLATVLPSGTAFDPPAALVVSTDTQQATRPLAMGDLLVIPPGTSPGGLAGWQEVALVEPCTSGQAIHLPRWVSGSRAGDRIQYTLDNFAYADSGLTVQEVGAETVFTFTGGAEWNDSSANPTGGLNNLVDLAPIPYPNDNQITLKLYDLTGALVETVVLQGALVSGGLGGGILASKPEFYAHQWRCSALGFVQQLGTAVGYSVSLDCTGQGSRLGMVDPNRVQFHESFDLSFAQPSGAVTPAGVSVETRLDVRGVLAPDGSLLTVNRNQYINANSPLRFRTRPGGLVGTWDGSVGTLTAPSVVQMGGTAIDLTTPALAIPGCAITSVGTILSGVGYAGDSSVSLGDNRVVDISVTAGDVARVEPGDWVYVDGLGGQATVKQGAYHVHHAITGGLYREEPCVSFAGFPGLLGLEFPVCQSYFGGTLLVDAVPQVTDENDALIYSFAPSGRVWLVRDLSEMTGTTANGLVSASYTGRSATSFTGLADWRDGDLNPVLESVFAAAAASNARVAGHRWVQVWTQGTGFTPYQTAGYHNLAGGVLQTIRGFREIVLEHPLAPGSHTWASTALSLTPAVNQVGVVAAVHQADGGDLLDEKVALWSGIPRLLDLSQVLGGGWASPFYGAAGYGAILPGTKMTVSYRAQSGLFLEPSSPRPVRNLGSATPRLVDQQHSLPSGDMGMRAPATYGGLAGLEQVRLSVRRGRPHSQVAHQYNEALQAVMRSDALWSAGVTAHQYTGTGGFAWIALDREHTLVPGDLLKSGTLWAQVVSVLADQSIITTPLPSVSTVTLWKRRPSIQQALEECLETIGRTVLTGTATASTLNQLVDPNLSSFVGLVEPGDIVIIDPAGSLATALSEMGEGPQGSTGVPGRAGWVAGNPSSWDDNRGFYRVTAVGSYLSLDPEHSYTGTFESGDYEYALYPLTSGGQNDLLPTGDHTGGSYLGVSTSVPNSYRVIRPDPYWSSEIVDLVLQERERHLTWIDLLGTDKATGSYRATRLNCWASLVWHVNRPAPGWITNPWISDIRGEVTQAPYLSSNMSVSILERRFWSSDPLLESTGPGPFWTDRVNGRGGLLRNDRIAILIGSVRSEAKRWIKYLTNRLNGSR
jgi:hypothetical protein